MLGAVNTTGPARWAPGTTIVHREIWNGRLWAVRPMTVVSDAPDLLVTWIPAGTVRLIPTTPPHRTQ